MNNATAPTAPGAAGDSLVGSVLGPFLLLTLLGALLAAVSGRAGGSEGQRAEPRAAGAFPRR